MNNSHVKTGNEQGNFARNTLVVSGATLGSRILGFVRDCLFAALLGAGPQADALFVAFRLPNLFRRLFNEGALALAIVTEYTAVREKEGLERAFAFVRACAVLFTIILLVVLFFCWLFADGLVALLAPGFLDHPALLAETASLLRIVLPYCLLICGVALLGAVLNAQNHFAAPALAPCALNVALILAGIVGWGGGFSLPVSFCIGLLLGGFCQLIMQAIPVHKLGFRWCGEMTVAIQQAASTGRSTLPALFGAAVFQLSILLTTFLASWLDSGSISYLSYADRLVQFPLGVFAMAVGTATLPELASLAVKGSDDAFRLTLFHSVRLTVFISLPAAAGLAGLAFPIVNVLFGRGAFGPDAVHSTALALQGYAVGIPALAVLRPMLAACYARKNVRALVSAGMWSLLIALLAGLLLMQLWGHVGLAVGAAIGAWANTFALHKALLDNEGQYIVSWGSIFSYAALSVLVLGACSYAAAWGSVSLVVIPVIILSYLVIAHLLGSPDTRLFQDVISRKA